MHGGLILRIGGAARTKPLCRNFGFSRGTPIDRYYIEEFLRDHAADIRGHVLEIADDNFSRNIGGSRVTRQDVLHVTGNAQATIVGDLTKPGVLPAATYDCIILTQTMQYIFDIAAAVRQIHHALKPGGIALITAPGITPIGRGENDGWYWSLTPASLERLLSGPFEVEKVSVRAYGNLYAASTFLLGVAVQEVRTAKLDAVDEAYPVTVAARAVA